MFTKEQIKENIATNFAWTIRTLEVLYSRQTVEERLLKETQQNNSMGFNGTDAKILSSFAEQVAKRKQYNNPQLLSDKQLEIARRLLPKYWKQIKEEIEKKQTA